MLAHDRVSSFETKVFQIYFIKIQIMNFRLKITRIYSTFKNNNFNV